MRTLTIIYDIGYIKAEYISAEWDRCTNIALWNRKHMDDVFYAWLVRGLEKMYCVVPSRYTYDILKSTAHSWYSTTSLHHLESILYQHVKIPTFNTANYQCHIRVVKDDLFLVFH